jgi:pimeloyl-ACP methyl ester carboxylesterase
MNDRTFALQRGSDDTPILALHSSGASGRQWTRLRETLGDRVAVVTPDFHDHGAGPAWEDDAQDIVAADTALALRALDALGRPAHVIGHSYGGAIALHVARARPRLVRTLTVYEPVAFDLLLGCDPRHVAAAVIVAVGEAIGRRTARGDTTAAAALFVAYWSGESAWDAMNERARATLALRMPAIAAHFQSLFAGRLPVTALTSINCPVLLATGGATHRPVQRIAQLLTQWLPDVSHARLCDAGHMGPLTHADAFLDLLAAFLASQGPVAALNEAA